MPGLISTTGEPFGQATKLLTDLGHRRIGLINGNEAITFATHRRQGYEDPGSCWYWRRPFNHDK